MEEAAELANYLPLSFKTPKEQKYIEFLWDAFETNYSNQKHQFAFLAYHMLTAGWPGLEPLWAKPWWFGAGCY